MTREPYWGVGRIAAISGVILLLSCGLCGAGFYFEPNQYVTFEGLFGFIGLWIGGIGLIMAFGTASLDFVVELGRKHKERK